MRINFKDIAEEKIEGFKGGHGLLLTRNYIDDRSRIMRSVLKPNAASGLHKHETNCEVVLILSGTATFFIDNEKETVEAGEVHYCPMGSEHYMQNDQNEDLVYLAIVI